ncbi:hypothetical protein ACFLTL_00205 [Chloroflexota bacterium]
MNVLDMLAANEVSIGQLYNEYANMFPEYSDFWDKLAKEEYNHARWLTEVSRKAVEGSLHIDERRFTKEAVESYRKYLQGECEKARREGISLLQALSIALNIEESLIESKYFEVLEADPTELRRILSDLEIATKEHMRRVRNIWLENR